MGTSQSVNVANIPASKIIEISGHNLAHGEEEVIKDVDTIDHARKIIEERMLYSCIKYIVAIFINSKVKV